MSFGDYVAQIFDWDLSKEQKNSFNRAYEDALNAGIPQRNPVIFRKNGKSTLSTWHMVMRSYYLNYDTLTDSRHKQVSL